MSCGIDCIKWFLFVFNFLWVLLGIAVLAVGIYVTVSVNEASGTENALAAIAIGFIVLGVIIFVIAFFGCCGAVRESHCMVVTYAVFLLAILIVQVAFGIWAFVIDTDPKTNVSTDSDKRELEESFQKYWISKPDRDYIDIQQTLWSCCGVSGPSDYNRIGNKTLPSTCCPLPETLHQNSNSYCSHDKAFKNGCSNRILEIFDKIAKVSGGIAIGVAVAELVGIIFALCLANSIRNDHRRGYRV